jgi:hypothetical protein
VDLRALTTIFFASCVGPQAVPWARSYGGAGRDTATALVETADGGVLLAGTTMSSFGSDGTHLWLVRVAADGSVVWQEMLAGGKSEAHPVVTARAGGFIVAATTYSDGAGKADLWLASLNDDGSIAWQQALGGSSDDLAAQVAVRSDGSIVVLGTTSSFGEGENDWLVASVGADGTVISTFVYGDNDEQDAAAFALASDDSLILAGQSTHQGDSDIAFASVDTQGTLGNVTAIGGTGTDVATAIAIDGGGFTLLGTTTSFGAGGTDAWVLSGTGNAITGQRSLGTSGEDALVGLRSHWAVGTTTVGTDSQMWLVGLATGGAVSTEMAYGGTGVEIGAAIGQAPNGNLWLQGTTSSFGNTGPDFWLLRLGASANLYPFGGAITTTHTNTTAKSRALTFVTNAAALVSTPTTLEPQTTNGRVIPQVGD